MNRSKTWLLALLVAVASLPLAAQTLPSGSEIKVRADTAITADANHNVGKRYTARVVSDVTDSSGRVAIPRGAPATLVVERDGDKVALDLSSVTVGGRRYAIESKAMQQGGVGANKRTAKWTGGGAAAGAVLGAILGGGKGAAIGAVAGGAAGAGAQTYTKGKSIDIKPETELTFKLAEDLQLRRVGTR